jgi:dTDP-4-amino-4,6-dideoxygalactose transaminase
MEGDVVESPGHAKIGVSKIRGVQRMIVKMFDLARDHKEMKNELLEITEKVLVGGEFILGKEVGALEDAFAHFIGVKHAVSVGSGTDAIKIAGLAYGLKRGDKIVTTPNTYIATAMSLSLHGITPVFCDIETKTYTMDAERLEYVLGKEEGIKLCIPVHLYGHPFFVDEITDVCRNHGLGILEDACQAHGSLYKGKKVGSFGDASAFSFYPTKNLGCYGDGGIVLTNSDSIYENALMLRNHGQQGRHVHVIEGCNSRLDELQAAILAYKLKKLAGWNEKRRKIASWYRRELKGAPVTLPEEAPWGYHVYHLFVVRVEKRGELMEYLASKGIATLIHYPTPIHLQDVYKSLGYEKGSFPNAERVSDEIVSLPLYPSLAEEEVKYVCDCIRGFYGV